ncbi:MAG: lytic transglycosylase domain-containing protein [candidate division KSB1 bacterium]|nr:lytic transglycosylase domain-containing protein [candidate division KSB1 bacterium]
MKYIKPTISILVFAAILSITGYSYYKHQLAKAQQEISYMSDLLTRQEHLIETEKQRKRAVRKVLNIINRYNSDMSDSTKQDVANEIYLMSRKYENLNIDLIAATITHESAATWEPTVTSRAGAMGLMQIMPATGAYLAYEEGMNWTFAEDLLFDPLINIQLGCRYLNELVGMYEEDGGLAAYNGGPRRAEMWIDGNKDYNILWKETREYVPAVMRLYDRFKVQETL